MKTILVLGATGTLGAYVALHFKEKGYRVIATGHRKSDNGFFSEQDIEYHTLDITKPEDFTKLPLEGVDVVADFAGALPASMKGYDATLYINSIFAGTYNVLEYMRKANIPKIIFPQSLFDVSYLFGSKTPIPADSERRAPLTGDHAMYVIAKIAAVETILHYQAVYGIKAFILRLSRVYTYHPNPYTYRDGEKVMVSDRLLIKKAENGDPIAIWGDPDKLLETCAMPDFLQIVEKCVESEGDGGIYNIGSGGSTLDERIKGIVEVFSPENNRSIISYAPEKPSARQFVLDIEKTKRELGYEPRYSWLDYCRWFKEEQHRQRFAKLWGKEEDYE
ncbi:MAG: NAD(P)-dependent oxidoreductase [Lachnospiraceae bacterium]|nr:NAD(P)-dependent oxidoreductase [Lachnospiraceae bacterium]